MMICWKYGLLIIWCMRSEKEVGRSVQAAYLQQTIQSDLIGVNDSFALWPFCTLWQLLKECKQALRLCKYAVLSEDSYWERSIALTSVCFLTEKRKERSRKIQNWCQMKWHNRCFSKKFQPWINYYIQSGFILALKEETCRKKHLIMLIAAPHSFEARGERTHGVVVAHRHERWVSVITTSVFHSPGVPSS